MPYARKEKAPIDPTNERHHFRWALYFTPCLLELKFYLQATNKQTSVAWRLYNP